MPLKFLLAASAATLALATAAFAGETIEISDAYARASSPNAKSGAAFMVLTNHAAAEDRLIGAESPAAARVELHTHIQTGDGVMQMREDEDGFEIPAGGSHMLMRGGDHVMFMGLTRPFEQGAMIPVTLTFEKAGAISVEIPVDLERQPNHGMMHTPKSGG